MCSVQRVHKKEREKPQGFFDKERQVKIKVYKELSSQKDYDLKSEIQNCFQGLV